MCLTPISININASRPQGLNFATVPCGKCEECRKSIKNSWSFRLGVELEARKKLGWSIGFLTLTYNDRHLPHVPKSCMKKGFSKLKVPCFSRKHLRDFIDNLRKRMYEVNPEYKENNKLVYFGASEYGSSTQRPHYHVLLCWNSSIGVDEMSMFNLVKRNWKHGFIFPRDFEGGIDGKGYEHKPFIVNASAYNAARYCGKYVCKDLSFEKTLEHVNTSMEAFRNCKYFHLQSKSLGLSLISGMSQDEKKNLLIHGYAFEGEEAFVMVPCYIKKKLIFDNYYIYVDEHLRERTKKKGEPLPSNWKRLCRIRANEFFRDNVDLIYKKQVEFYKSVFDDFKDDSFCWRNGYYDFVKTEEYRKNIESKRHQICNAIQEYEDRFKRSFVGDFIGFGCRDYNYSFDIPASLLFLNRYCDDFDYTGVPLVDREVYNSMHSIIVLYINFLKHAQKSRMTVNDLILDEVDDFLNNPME